MQVGDGRSTSFVALMLAVVLALSAKPAGAQDAAEALWAALKEGGRVILMRNAPAPAAAGAGGGDEGSSEGCDAARDLSVDGQAIARRLGEAFKAQEVPVAAVQSSRSCRALGTADLAFEKAEPWPALDPLFTDRARREAQTAEVGERIVGWTGPGNLVLVTHAANIAAFTGLELAEGEVIVLRPRPDGTYSVEWRFTIKLPAEPS